MKNIEKKNIRLLAIIMCLIAFCCCVGIVLMPTIGSKVEINNTRNESSILHCIAKDIDEYVLMDKKVAVSGNEYDIRLSFVNDDLNNASIIVSKEFDNQNDATIYANKLEAKYNIYIGNNNINTKGMVASYTHVDNIGRMTLSMNPESLNIQTMPLLLMNPEENMILSMDALSNYYSKHGFVCTQK